MPGSLLVVKSAKERHSLVLKSWAAQRAYRSSFSLMPATLQTTMSILELAAVRLIFKLPHIEKLSALSRVEMVQDEIIRRLHKAAIK